MTIDDARRKYDETVRKNLKNIEAEKLKDPDCTFNEKVTLVHPFLNAGGAYKVEVSLASDGICGVKTIDKMVSLNPKKYKRKDLYQLIRHNRFDCLIWPTYAMSINQMRYSVFRDRLDLTLMDIEHFYEIIDTEANAGNAFSMSTFERIENECRLSRAYFNIYTLAWLCSFKNFNDFVEKRNLQKFVECKGKNYHASLWAGESIKLESKEFAEYFEALVKRLGKK